jgi:hypothetical protein
MENIAREVLQGKWGNGTDRVNRLRAAGYDPNTIQQIVNNISYGRPVNQGVTIAQPIPTTPIATAVQDISNQFTKNINQTPQSFESVIPFSTVVNEPVLKSFGDSIVNYDAYKNAAQAYDNQRRQQFGNGSWRAGGMADQNLLNDYERQRQTQSAQMADEARTNLTNYYNAQKDAFNKDPNAVTNPNFTTGLQNLAKVGGSNAYLPSATNNSTTTNYLMNGEGTREVGTNRTDPYGYNPVPGMFKPLSFMY